MLRLTEILEPASLEEACGWLARYGDEAACYAGGTELILVMKAGLVSYPRLVNLKTIPGLDAVAISADGKWLEMGSLATHRQLHRSALVQRHAPLLSEVEATIANARVRAVGTIGGNLCFAEPHSDPATLLLAWGATVELASAAGRRSLRIADFVLGTFETARRPEEILASVRLPMPAPHTAGAYEKFATHERPTATAAALLRLQGGVIADARLAVGSVGPSPVRATEAEALLNGQAPGEAVFRAAAQSAAGAVEPIDDIYGSGDYKRHIAGVLMARALGRAAARAAGRPGEN